MANSSQWLHAQGPFTHLSLVVKTALVADNLERLVLSSLVVAYLQHLTKRALAQHTDNLIPTEMSIT
jgi:hypothetical protein